MCVCVCACSTEPSRGNSVERERRLCFREDCCGECGPAKTKRDEGEEKRAFQRWGILFFFGGGGFSLSSRAPRPLERMRRPPTKEICISLLVGVEQLL